ncbi:hypothetical protein LOK49_LG03G02531 [Camellia lanceoleosa]|uniref:Uncharacterized protein n=1 Tax=Camellia lanceoleosa TaxID=1840588 RepID=A0ACC0IG77_9ERIC|nr:hypothetical protein LOK49_LG03G02531 [Camellia lanceoleosa]
MNRAEERAETGGVELEDDDDGQDGVDSAARERENVAVFDQSVAKSPEGLRSQSSVSESSTLKDGSLIQDLYSSLHPNSVTINLGLPGFIAYSSHKQSPLLPQFWM